MPSQRAQGKTLMNMWLDDDLLMLVEHARRKLGNDRSRFARDALVAYLRALGYPLEQNAGAPAIDRARINVGDVATHNSGYIGSVNVGDTTTTNNHLKKRKR